MQLSITIRELVVWDTKMNVKSNQKNTFYLNCQHFLKFDIR